MAKMGGRQRHLYRMLVGLLSALCIARSYCADARRTEAISKFVRAFEADNGGDFSEAVRLYSSVLSEQPNCDEAHWNLALGFAKRQRHSESLHHFEEVARIHGDASLVRSEGELQKLLPPQNHLTALNNIGLAYLNAGRTAEAEAHWQRALGIDPLDRVARDHLQAQQAKRPDAAPPPPRPAFPAVERVTTEQLLADPLLFSGARPFVLTGATEEWAARARWADLQYFRALGRELGGKVDYYPFNLAEANRKPWLLHWDGE